MFIVNRQKSRPPSQQKQNIYKDGKQEISLI